MLTSYCCFAKYVWIIVLLFDIDPGVLSLPQEQCYKLGEVYDSKDEFSLTRSRAAQWYRKAAEQGNK